MTAVRRPSIVSYYFWVLMSSKQDKLSYKFVRSTALANWGCGKGILYELI
jgi:hypothetical protein